MTFGFELCKKLKEILRLLYKINIYCLLIKQIHARECSAFLSNFFYDYRGTQKFFFGKQTLKSKYNNTYTGTYIYTHIYYTCTHIIFITYKYCSRIFYTPTIHYHLLRLRREVFFLFARQRRKSFSSSCDVYMQYCER